MNPRLFLATHIFEEEVTTFVEDKNTRAQTVHEPVVTVDADEDHLVFDDYLDMMFLAIPLQKADQGFKDIHGNMYTDPDFTRRVLHEDRRIDVFFDKRHIGIIDLMTNIFNLVDGVAVTDDTNGFNMEKLLIVITELPAAIERLEA